ncbi:MAG: relaxase domain-containing protein, partial [Acidobacteriaceae bacterium]
QERSFFQSKQFATAVFRSELFYRLRGLGYEIEAGKSGVPEIAVPSEQICTSSSFTFRPLEYPTVYKIGRCHRSMSVLRQKL